MMKTRCFLKWMWEKFPRSFSSVVGGRLPTGRRQLPRLSHRNASSPPQRRLGMTSDSDELEPTKKATCSFDIIGVPDAKKIQFLLMLKWKLHYCRWKFQVPPSSFFLIFCCLFCQELCWLQPGLELFCILFRTHATWIYVEFLVVSNILFSPRTLGKLSNYIQLDSYFSDELTKTTN